MRPKYRWITPRAFVATSAPFALALVAACGGGGGGGDKPGGPTAVASVEALTSNSSIEVGDHAVVSAKYFDASHNQLSGRTVSFSSSNSSIATVDAYGTVTGVAVGSVSVQATVEGKSGSVPINVVPVAVASIAITPANPAVRQGETITLSGQPQDILGRPLAGRAVAWSSANPAIATINASTGLVTAVLAGTTYIRAESEGKRDSVNLRVKSLNAPTITGASSGQLTPGSSGTVTGVNFGATPNDNQILINGAEATITAASSTSVTFTVPAATGLPCTPTGAASVMLVANGDTSSTTMQLKMATPRSLGVGQSLLLTGQADIFCNEFSATGGRYLVTAFNYAPDALSRTSFQLLGASASGASSQVAANVQSAASVPAGPLTIFEDRMTRHLRAHLAQRQNDAALARQLGSPHVRGRMRRPNGALLSLGGPPVAPPNVGDVVTYRMQRNLGSYSSFDNVRFRAVYVGSKIILYEDSLAPLARNMDAEYQRLGEEFDNVIWPILLNFGNPLVVDSALDNNGHMIALFSKRVNNYTVNGQSNVLLGFVTLCDFFPRVPQVIDGIPVDACPASNEGETFYAIVPDPNATTGTLSIINWRRYMRATLAHEAKHVTSYAERYYRDASALEETWLEEATAQVSSEIFSRGVYSRPRFGDIGWADGPNCDYAGVSVNCPDPMEGILHHFNFLYNAYVALENKSLVDPSVGFSDPVIYGYSWSFVRWLTDTYGPDERTFLRSIVQVQNDTGVMNLEGKTGRTFSELLGLFSLASLADNYPGATVNDPRLKLASWNSRDLFSGMHDHLVFGSSGLPAFPQAWPLAARSATFGTFTSTLSDVTLLPGGGFAAWDISGAQASPQVLAIRSSNGGLPPPQIGLGIVRVQ